MVAFLIGTITKMFNTKLPLYGIFIISSFIIGLGVIYKNTKQINLTKDETMGLLIYIFLGSIFVAKYFTFFTNYYKYNGVFDLLKVGFSSYGALIGIVIMLLIFSRQYRKSFNKLFYCVLPSVPIMYATGKIGCFLTGCCYGIKYNGPFNISYNYSYFAPAGVKLFPVQILETIVFVLIYFWIRNKKLNRVNAGWTLVCCGISKFLLDYLRINHVNVFISINQIFSIFFIGIGLFLVINKNLNE